MASSPYTLPMLALHFATVSPILCNFEKKTKIVNLGVETKEKENGLLVGVEKDKNHKQYEH